ncbi:MAG: T9SS C-terminal target domain-containing protein [Saprospirales bacterium]|nr:MAG: T9SS C-terminal target domain-containing protein [Saprospirales bacterium]
MKAISTLLLLLFFFNHSLHSQSNWWDDIDLPKDTIFISGCQDVEILINEHQHPILVPEYIFPSGIDDPNIVGNYQIKKTYDADSICDGGVIFVSLLNWNNLEVYEYSRILSIDPDLAGPCGQFYSFDKEKVEDGLVISDLDSNASDISFFNYSTGDTLFLPIPAYTKTYPVAITQNPGPSLCFVTVEVQVEGWYEAIFHTDTVYISDCSDIEPLLENPLKQEIVKEWICPNCHELTDIVGAYYIEKSYDTDSNCNGGIMHITLLNWSNLAIYEYERVIKINPELEGPCGDHFLFEYEEIEEGLQFSDLGVHNSDLSFFPNGADDPLVLNLTESGIFNIPVFQAPGPSVCFFKFEVDVKPACLDTFLLQVNEDFVMTVGDEFCGRLTLGDLGLEAEYYCEGFEVGFLNSENLLTDQIDLNLNLDYHEKMEELMIVMRTWDNQEFSINFDIKVVIDSSHLNSVFMFTDDPYLLEGETTYIGIGANLRNTPAIQGEILFPGAKILNVEVSHPYLKPENYGFNNDYGFFRFLFADPWNVLTFEDGTPWFVLQVQAKQEGYLSDLLDLSDPNNFNRLWVETDKCSPLRFYFTFNFSQELLFSSTDEIIAQDPLRIFPNPTSEKIYFDHEFDKIQEVKVFDMSGRLVLSKENLNKYLDVSQLNPGFYKLKLTTNKGRTTGGFIKQ